MAGRCGDRSRRPSARILRRTQAVPLHLRGRSGAARDVANQDLREHLPALSGVAPPSQSARPEAPLPAAHPTGAPGTQRPAGPHQGPEGQVLGRWSIEVPGGPAYDARPAHQKHQERRRRREQEVIARSPVVARPAAKTAAWDSTGKSDVQHPYRPAFQERKVLGGGLSSSQRVELATVVHYRTRAEQRQQQTQEADASQGQRRPGCWRMLKVHPC